MGSITSSSPGVSPASHSELRSDGPRGTNPFTKRAFPNTERSEPRREKLRDQSSSTLRTALTLHSFNSIPSVRDLHETYFYSTPFRAVTNKCFSTETIHQSWSFGLFSGQCFLFGQHHVKRSRQSLQKYMFCDNQSSLGKSKDLNYWTGKTFSPKLVVFSQFTRNLLLFIMYFICIALKVTFLSPFTLLTCCYRTLNLTNSYKSYLCYNVFNSLLACFIPVISLTACWRQISFFYLFIQAYYNHTFLYVCLNQCRSYLADKQKRPIPTIDMISEVFWGGLRDISLLVYSEILHHQGQRRVPHSGVSCQTSCPAERHQKLAQLSLTDLFLKDWREAPATRAAASHHLLAKNTEQVQGHYSQSTK